jgi:membrane protease YdiL (CAAX protease family)
MAEPRLTLGQVLGFLALSHGWTWAFWGAGGLMGTSIWEFPATIFLYVGGAGVFLGGVVMSRVAYGPAGLRDLGRRIVDPRPIGGRWWAVILVFFPLLTLIAAGAALLLGASARPLDLEAAAARLANPAGLLAMMGFILLIGPLPEEIGWRGYLQDRLQTHWSALAASLLVGVIWWSWHLPLFVLPGYFDAFGRANPTPLDFLYGILPSAVLYARVYVNTDRSVLAVILFHFMENFSGEFLGIAEEARPYRLALMVLLVVLVVWWWGPRTLRGARAGSRDGLAVGNDLTMRTIRPGLPADDG